MPKQPVHRNKKPARLRRLTSVNMVQWDAERIKELRQHLALDQAGFANVLHVRRQTVCDWERGNRIPREQARLTLSRIAQRARFEPSS